MQITISKVDIEIKIVIFINKREAFRQVFDNFDTKKIAKYEESKIQELMQNEKIIRNRLKIKSAITNTKLFLQFIE